MTSSDKPNEICAICLADLTLPAILECGHEFCHQCITSLCDAKDNSKCPLCRAPINPEILEYNVKDLVRGYGRGKVSYWEVRWDDGSVSSTLSENLRCDKIRLEYDRARKRRNQKDRRLRLKEAKKKQQLS